MNVATYIDHTILKPTATFSDIEALCKEAIQFQFAAVCVPPSYVKVAKHILFNTPVKVATVVGFPFGYSSTNSKLAEINDAIRDGVDEIDFVHNLGALKNNDWIYLAKEIAACLQPVRLHGKILKVIIESGILTDKEIIDSCKLYAKHKVDYIKTSTGYAEKGASIEAVELIKQHIPEYIHIKASGGITDYNTAMQYIDLGVHRIGTSSGVSIVKAANKA